MTTTEGREGESLHSSGNGDIEGEEEILWREGFMKFAEKNL